MSRAFLSEGSQRRLNIFLSSTFRDLRFFRAEARDLIVKLGHYPVAMEYFNAQPTDPETVIEGEIRKCDIFIGVYGFYYGYTPGANRTSITWLEYEFAKAIGKPRFCFLADERLKFPGSIEMTADENRLPTFSEKDWKQDKLVEFKRVLSEELVRETFSSRGDLCAKVAVAISDFIQGRVMGQPTDEILKRWEGWERGEQTDIYLNKLDLASARNDPGNWPSPLAHWWLEFASKTPWHQQQKLETEEIQSLLSIAPRTSEAVELSRMISHMPWGAKYATLLAGLRDAFVRKRIDPILTSLAGIKIRSDDGKAIREASSINRLRTLLTQVETNMQCPRFGRCFQVVGSMGAGKTHFIASLLAGDENAVSSRNYLVMPFTDPIQAGALETEILERIRRATALPWLSLSQFDEFLGRAGRGKFPPGGLRLFIAIDDLGNWFRHDRDLKNALMKFVRDCTLFHSIYWIFTLQDTDLDLALEDFFQVFSGAGSLQRTGYERNVFTIGEWFVLDDFNREHTTGVKILKKELGVADDEEIGLDFAKNQDSFRHVCHPFVAWTLLELRDEKVPLETIVDLHFIEFVQLHWQKRCRTLMKSGARQVDLEQCIEFVARYVASTGEIQPFRTRLVEKIKELAGDRSELRHLTVVKDCMDALASGGILRTVFVQEDIPVEKIELHQEYFWFWRLGKVLLTLSGCYPESIWHGEPDWGVFDQTCRRYGHDRERDGMVEFFLMLLDSMCPWSGTSGEAHWYKTILRSDAGIFSPASIWFAGAKISFPARQTLLDLAVQLRYLPTERRTFFAFMHFLGKMGEEANRGPDVLSLLRKNFHSIAQCRLQDYYFFIVKRVICCVVSAETLLQCARNCYGCEILKLQEAIASLTIQRCYELIGNTEGVLEWIWKFLNIEEVGVRAEEGPPGDVTGWRRHSYREWILFSFCHLTTFNKGIGAFTFLADNSWFKRSTRVRDPRTYVEMEREATIALGHYYRHSRDWTDDEEASQCQRGYLSLVEQCTGSSVPREKEIAFHLIRHTVPTFGRVSAVEVDEQFRPFLLKMMSDPGMETVVNKFKTFFDRNATPHDERD